MSDVEYVLYTGDKINTVSLWRREGDTEHPIYANTRGKCEWYSFDADTYENTEPNALSDELVEWLAEYHRRITGQGDMQSNLDMEDPKWYEAEILNAIGDPQIPPEQFELMEWAYNEVQE